MVFCLFFKRVMKWVNRIEISLESGIMYIWTFKYLLTDFVYNTHFFLPFAILYINLSHKESLLLK